MSLGAFVSIVAGLVSLLAASRAVTLPSTAPADRIQLVFALDAAQRSIDDPAQGAAQLATAGQYEQLATAAMARAPRSVRSSVLAALDRPAAAALRADLEAAGALGRLAAPRRSTPRWRIIAPPAADVLRSYFEAAQARFGVPWEYLAAIEFVETKFGRIDGLSTAGAEGPMQFIPATWARYGAGNVHNPRDAIFGAARYLTANGAPADMPDALLHYNPSSDYVRAVTDYAGVMRADRRAYYGYYWWQVMYPLRGRVVILPVGYPKLAPLALTSPAGHTPPPPA